MKFLIEILFPKWMGLCIWVTLVLLGLSCISVNLESIKDQPATGVTYTPPPAPYSLIKGGRKNNANEADATWIHQSTGQKISFYSNCAPSAHINSLNQLEKDLLEGIDEHIKEKDESKVHSGVPARFLQMEVKNSKGSVYLMEMFFFKKAKCFYVLTWLAPKTKEEETTSLQPNIEFSQFIKGFIVP